MTLAALLLVVSIGAVASAWGGRRDRRSVRVGVVVGTLALLAVPVLALALEVPTGGANPASSAGSLFGGELVASDYLRVVVALWALDAVALVVIGWLAGGVAALRGILPGTLAAIAGGTVALAASSLVLGGVAAAATGLAALLVVLVSERAWAVPAAARELRVSLGGAALLLAAVVVAPVGAAIVLGDRFPADGGASVDAAAVVGQAGAVVGVAALAVALAVGIRAGAIPFHVRVPRLADAVPALAAPLLLAWLPLPVGVVGLAAVDRLVTPLALPLEGERAIIVGFALLTLIAAAVAAFIQDDLRHAAGYLVIADAGFVLLGLAAMDPAAWGPTRVWLVALAASKTTVAAWAAVAEARYETRSLPDLRGWIRRAPILAGGFALAILATFGLPGWVAFEARGELARLSVEPPWTALLVVAGFLTLPVYLRIVAIGLGPPSTPVRRAAPERILPPRKPADTATAMRAQGPAVPRAVPDAFAGTAAATPLPVEHGRDPGSGPASPQGTLPGALQRAANAMTAVRLAADAMGRHRAELTSGAVLVLALLAVLTSWGAMDLGGAASTVLQEVPGAVPD